MQLKNITNSTPEKINDFRCTVHYIDATLCTHMQAKQDTSVVSPFQYLVKSVCLDGSYEELARVDGLTAITAYSFRSYYSPAAGKEYLVALFFF